MTATDAATWLALVAPFLVAAAAFAVYLRKAGASEVTESFTVEFIPERADVDDQLSAVDQAMRAALASREVTA